MVGLSSNFLTVTTRMMFLMSFFCVIFWESVAVLVLAISISASYFISVKFHHLWWWCNALGFEIEFKSFMRPSKFFISAWSSSVLNEGGMGWFRQSHGPSLLWSTSGDLTSAMTGSRPDWNASSLLTCRGFWTELSFSVTLLEWLVSQLEEPLLPESLLPSGIPFDNAQLSFFRCTGNGFLKGLEGWGRTAKLFGIVAQEFEMIWCAVDDGGIGPMIGKPVEEPGAQKLFIGWLPWDPEDCLRLCTFILCTWCPWLLFPELPPEFEFELECPLDVDIAELR